LYPDVAEVGTLTLALQEEFARQGRTHHVVPYAEPPNSHRTARVQIGDRQAEAVLDPWRRQFVTELRDETRMVASGATQHLADAAVAMDRWVSGARASQVAAECPFLGSVELAEARERGDKRAANWLLYYEDPHDDPVLRKLRAFVVLAFHESRLRELWPYTSVWSLHFSTTPYPYSRDCPAVTPGPRPDWYVVGTPDHRVHEATDAPDTLRLVLAGLPDIGRGQR
jgi:hypothetical protein